VIHSFADRVVSRTERKSVLPDVVISTFREVRRRAQCAVRADCHDSRGKLLVEVGDRDTAGRHEGEVGEWTFEAHDQFRAVQACRKDLDDVCAGVVGSHSFAGRQRAEHRGEARFYHGPRHGLGDAGRREESCVGMDGFDGLRRLHNGPRTNVD